MKAVFAGTFDPFTEGHFEIFKKAAELFDEIVVAVADDSGHKAVAPLSVRIEIVKASVCGLDNVRVSGFKGLLTDFMKSEGAFYLVRGLRNTYDFSYEQNLAEVYERQFSEFKEVYFISAHKYMCVSGTIVRELAALNGSLDGFVVPAAIGLVKKAYGK